MDTLDNGCIEDLVAERMLRDAELDPAHVPYARGRFVPAPLKHVLLTGATGFLGANLLLELLRNTEATVHCVVPASDAAAGMGQLRTALETRKLPWSKALERRVVVVLGFLDAPRLGWSEAEFERLAGVIDGIYHCGSRIDYLSSYEALRAANVESTRWLLALAVRSRLKPLHHVSTMGVMHSHELLSTPCLREERTSELCVALPTGFQRSMWVSECLIGRAQERGVPITVYRPGQIAFDSSTGVYNPDDLFLAMLRSSHHMGVMPAFRQIDVAPVDWVARALVALSLDDEARGRIFHLTHPAPLSTERMHGWYELGGLGVRLEPVDAWIERARDGIAADPGHPLAPFEALVRSAPEKNLLRIVALAPPASTDNSTPLLAEASVVCPPLTREQLLRWYAKLREDGLVAPPWSGPAGPGRYIWYTERMRGYCAGEAEGERTANAFRTAHDAGEQAGDVLELDVTVFVDSLHEVVERGTLQVEGTLRCSPAHPQPLRITRGSVTLWPHDGLSPRDALEVTLLRWDATLVDDDGRAYALLGNKYLSAGLDMMKQTTTLETVLRCADGRTWVGQMAFGFKDFLKDQIGGLHVREDISEKERLVARSAWLALLGMNVGKSMLHAGLGFATQRLFGP